MKKERTKFGRAKRYAVVFTVNDRIQFPVVAETSGGGRYRSKGVAHSVARRYNKQDHRTTDEYSLKDTLRWRHHRIFQWKVLDLTTRRWDECGLDDLS